MFAKFNQSMYLRDFPVDTQWISVVISTRKSAEEIELLPDPEGSKICARNNKQVSNPIFSSTFLLVMLSVFQ